MFDPVAQDSCERIALLLANIFELILNSFCFFFFTEELFINLGSDEPVAVVVIWTQLNPCSPNRKKVLLWMGLPILC